MCLELRHARRPDTDRNFIRIEGFRILRGIIGKVECFAQIYEVLVCLDNRDGERHSTSMLPLVAIVVLHGMIAHILAWHFPSEHFHLLF